MKLIKPSFLIKEQEPGLEGIYKQIEWAGRHCYKSHDKITEDSAKKFVDRMIKSGHCYTGDVEILTDKGFIKWKDYNGERVAVVNKNCSFKGFELPKNIIKYEFEGNFYTYPRLGITVTDGHKMFGIFRIAGNDFYNNTDYELFSCNTFFKDNNGREKTLGERMFKSPIGCFYPNTDTDPYYELIGFWLGDGCHCDDIKNKLKFHLKKERKIKYLKNICEKLNYNFEALKSNKYTVSYNNIGSEFNNKFYKNHNKYIEGDYTPLQIYSIFQGLINSDGSTKEGSKTITFTNTSDSIIEWMKNNAPLIGYNITEGVGRDNLRKLFIKTSKYIISNDSRSQDSKVIIQNKKEQVFCVETSTGLIIVRGRNGQTCVCGNCSTLEQGSVYLNIHWKNEIHEVFKDMFKFYNKNPYSKIVRKITNTEDLCPDLFISTNYRVLIEHDRLNDLKYLCEPTEYHEKRVCVKFICDRGVSHKKFVA